MLWHALYNLTFFLFFSATCEIVAIIDTAETKWRLACWMFTQLGFLTFQIGEKLASRKSEFPFFPGFDSQEVAGMGVSQPLRGLPPSPVRPALGLSAIVVVFFHLPFVALCRNLHAVLAAMLESARGQATPPQPLT